MVEIDNRLFETDGLGSLVSSMQIISNDDFFCISLNEPILY